MNPLFVRVALGLYLSASTNSLYTADTAAVAATLLEEAADYHSILQLCEGLRPQQMSLKTNTAEAARLLEAEEPAEQQTSEQLEIVSSGAASAGPLAATARRGPGPRERTG